MRTVAGKKKAIDLVASADCRFLISCVGRADIERDTSMDRSRERNLVGRIRTCALTGTSRWDGLRAALPSPVPLWRNRAMPGMPARQRGPCRGCPQGTGVCPQGTGAIPGMPLGTGVRPQGTGVMRWGPRT
jgi:hypothetical protein